MKHVSPGDELNIPARVYNGLLDILAPYPLTAGRVGRQRSQAGWCLASNTTGTDLVRFSIVGFGAPTILPVSNESAFLDCCCFNVVGASTIYRWGITQEAIPNGQFGQMLVSGVTAVKIDDAGGDDPGFAIPNGSYTSLTGTNCGICRVLWRQSGTGPQWALVNIG